jgi:hypothetical protein
MAPAQSGISTGLTVAKHSDPWDRKKPGVAFWTTVVLAVPILYVASFGPVCWAVSRVTRWSGPWGATNFLYSPILRVWYHDGATSKAIRWYANLGAGADLTVGQDDDGAAFLGIICHSP